MRKAEEEVGSPIYCRYAWIDAAETSCAYGVVGPRGFCWANGRLDGSVWKIETFVPWRTNPYASRWVLDAGGASSAPASSQSSDRQRDLRPFDYLTRSFLDTFGLFPAVVQSVFQEPFDTEPPQWTFSPWCTSARDVPGAQLRYRYYQWAFATNEASVAVAFGVREVVRSGHTSWAGIWGELMESPWQSARATWYSAPGDVPVEQDAYSLLGVEPTAGDEEIKHAYRRLARYLHPDSQEFGTGTGTPLRDFTALSAAYEAVKSEAARSAYTPTRTFRSSLRSSVGAVGWWVAPEGASRQPIDSPSELASRS